MTQKRDQNGHFKPKEIKAYSPEDAEKAARSPERLREEVERINRWLARGRRTIPLGSTDDALGDLLCAKYKESSWRRVSLQWIKNQRYLVLTK